MSNHPKKLSTIQCYSLVVALEIFVCVLPSILHSLYIYVHASLCTIIQLCTCIETESSGRCLSHCHANTVNLVTAPFSPLHSCLSSLALSPQIIHVFPHIHFICSIFLLPFSLFHAFGSSAGERNRNEQKRNKNNNNTSSRNKNKSTKAIKAAPFKRCICFTRQPLSNSFQL